MKMNFISRKIKNDTINLVENNGMAEYFDPKAEMG